MSNKMPGGPRNVIEDTPQQKMEKFEKYLDSITDQIDNNGKVITANELRLRLLERTVIDTVRLLDTLPQYLQTLLDLKNKYNDQQLKMEL